VPSISVNWLDVLVILTALVILATSFGFLIFAYYAFASIRLPVGNAAMLEGEPLPSISKAGGEIARQGSQLFRIQSERDIWVLYVWQGWLGKKQKTRLKRFKSYDKAMSYVAEYV